MESLLSDLEQGHFDAAIGAITITPEREKRVDLSYPAHRSGVAVALRKEKGPFAALKSYAAAATELGPLIISSLAMLVLIGIVMWLIERRHPSAQNSESSVVTLRDGLYWAIVTMTTVGYVTRRRNRAPAVSSRSPGCSQAWCGFRCCRPVWCRD
jgi:ABC-type amino acid transport substrate-binding protein